MISKANFEFEDQLKKKDIPEDIKTRIEKKSRNSKECLQCLLRQL